MFSKIQIRPDFSPTTSLRDTSFSEYFQLFKQYILDRLYSIIVMKGNKILYCRDRKCQYLDPNSKRVKYFFGRLLLAGPDKILIARLETRNGIKIGLFDMYEFWDPIAEKLISTQCQFKNIINLMY